MDFTVLALRARERFDAIVFDYDDTLAHSPRTRWPQIVLTAEHLGHWVSPDQIKQVWGLPYREMISDLMPGIDVDTFTSAYVASLQLIPNDFAPQSREIIEALRESGMELGILSSNSRTVIEQDFKAVGIDGVFKIIAGCDDVRHHKPDRRALDPVLHVLRKNDAPLSRFAMIGDSWRDARTAQSAGIQFFAVCTGNDDFASFVAEGVSATNICSSLVHALSQMAAGASD